MNPQPLGGANPGVSEVDNGWFSYRFVGLLSETLQANFGTTKR